MELLGKSSNWWTHYSKDGSFNAWGCQATCLVQVVLNQTLKCWSFERNTKRGLLIVPWVRLRSQNGWHWTLKTHISCHNLAFRSNGGEDQSDKNKNIQRAMLPRSAILYCTHFIEHESVPSNGGTLFQKIRFMIAYVEHIPEVSSTTQGAVRPMPLYCWFLNMKFSLILVVIVLTLFVLNQLWLHTWSILRLPTN